MWNSLKGLEGRFVDTLQMWTSSSHRTATCISRGGTTTTLTFTTLTGDRSPAHGRMRSTRTRCRKEVRVGGLRREVKTLGNLAGSPMLTDPYQRNGVKPTELSIVRAKSREARWIGMTSYYISPPRHLGYSQVTPQQPPCFRRDIIISLRETPNKRSRES